MQINAVISRGSLRVSEGLLYFDVRFDNVPGWYGMFIPLPDPLTKAAVAAAVRAKVLSRAAEISAERQADDSLQKIPDNDFSIPVDMFFPEGSP